MKQKASFASLTKFGLLFGIALIIIDLLKIVIGSNTSQIISYLFSLLNIAAYIFFISIAIKKAVETIYFNKYKVSNGILVGFYIGLITGILMFFYNYIDALFIRPEHYDMFMQQQLEIYGDDTENYYDWIKTVNHPAMIAFGLSFITWISIAIVSLFIAPFYKKTAFETIPQEESPEENQEN
jgi:hypothetical protein